MQLRVRPLSNQTGVVTRVLEGTSSGTPNSYHSDDGMDKISHKGGEKKDYRVYCLLTPHWQGLVHSTPDAVTGGLVRENFALLGAVGSVLCSQVVHYR